MKLSLRAVVLISAIGVQVVTVAAILFSSYWTTQDALLAHAQQLMREVSRYMIVRSEQLLDPASSTASLTQRLADSAILRTNDFAGMERYFYEQLRLYPWISGIYFGGTDGSFIFVKREPVPDSDKQGYLTKTISFPEGRREVTFIARTAEFKRLTSRTDPADAFDPRTRPWFIKSVSSGGITWTDPYIFFTAQRPGISVSSPVREGGEGHGVLGAIGVDIEISQISNFLAGLATAPGGSALILNRNGDVIAHPRIDKISVNGADGQSVRFVKIGELDDTLARAAFASLGSPADDIAIASPEVRSFVHDGNRYLAVFTPFFNANWPWTLVTYAPEDVYLGVLKRNIEFDIYLALAIALAGSLIGLLIWRSIVRPIRQLSVDAGAIREGNLKIDPQAHSVFREIDETADAFRQMVAGLRRQEAENLRLRRLQSRLLEQVRKSSVGQFASAVSHELNNPLAALAAYLEVAARLVKRNDPGDAARVTEMIGKTQEQTGRVGAIIRGLRDLVEAGEPVRVRDDVNEIVREAADLANTNEIMGGARLEVSLAPGPLPALVSRVQIQQVILNLLRNAVEVTSGLSHPVIRLATARRDCGVIEVSVTDNGPGLDETIAGRLFEPMVSTKSSGMGVGLSISRTIVEAHGGSIAARTADGGGAVFTFTVPCDEGQDLSEERTES